MLALHGRKKMNGKNAEETEGDAEVAENWEARHSDGRERLRCALFALAQGRQDDMLF
jgi:hypothetical protein